MPTLSHPKTRHRFLHLLPWRSPPHHLQILLQRRTQLRQAPHPETPKPRNPAALKQGSNTHFTMMHRHRGNNRVPPWADPYEIKAFYTRAAEWNESHPDDKLHVDHIIPVTSPFVCGLHTPANLQLTPHGINRTRSNAYWPDMFDYGDCYDELLHMIDDFTPKC